MKTLKARAAMIELELARMKHDFFVKGIQAPLEKRLGLELELKEIRSAKYTDEGLEHARKSQVMQARAVLIKQRLREVGMEHILDECAAEAEASIPPVVAQ
jgi:hypothetical protein